MFKYHASSEYFDTFEFEWRVDIKIGLLDLLNLKRPLKSPKFGCDDEKFSIDLDLEEAEGSSKIVIRLYNHHPSETMLVVFQVTAQKSDLSEIFYDPQCYSMNSNSSSVFCPDKLNEQTLYPFFTLLVKIDYCPTKILDNKDNKVASRCYQSFPSAGSDMLSNLVLLEDGILTDCTVKVGGEEIRVHKCILAQYSEFFCSVFEKKDSDGNKSSEFIIEDFTPETVRGMLEFIYGGKTEKVNADLTGSLAIANKYWIDALKEHCTAKLAENLNEENLFSVFALADATNSRRLMEECGLYLFGHRKLFDSEAWHDFRLKNEKFASDLTKCFTDTFARTLNLPTEEGDQKESDTQEPAISTSQ